MTTREEASNRTPSTLKIVTSAVFILALICAIFVQPYDAEDLLDLAGLLGMGSRYFSTSILDFGSLSGGNWGGFTSVLTLASQFLLVFFTIFGLIHLWKGKPLYTFVSSLPFLFFMLASMVLHKINNVMADLRPGNAFCVTGINAYFIVVVAVFLALVLLTLLYYMGSRKKSGA